MLRQRVNLIGSCPINGPGDPIWNYFLFGDSNWVICAVSFAQIRLFILAHLQYDCH
jgi:hypothetical protein